MPSKYTMTISRLTVDKLGVRLYDRVSAVIAELVSNSYDADAENVTVTAPLGVYLATKAGGAVADLGYKIIVKDDGIGMTPEEMQKFFLIVGRERRSDPARGDLSRKFKRAVMGRKGVGKLAPFGICKRIEVISSGGPEITRSGPAGAQKGYQTSHIILDYDGIVSDVDTAYVPNVGTLDDTLQPATGTEIILSNFAYRRVPDQDELASQLAQRFGLATGSWQVSVCDATKSTGAPDRCRDIGAFDVQVMLGTKLDFRSAPGPTLKAAMRPAASRTLDESGAEIASPTPGFEYDGAFYPVRGWVAYSKAPYKDDLMAGVRIYCRGKLAAQTPVFNLKAGFTGEHSIRSYLVGELHCDWLDQDDDLIQTDRRDILWSHDLGQRFEEWGQSVVKAVGVRSRDPMRKKALDLFIETSRLEERLEEEFPGEEEKSIRVRAREIASMFGRKLREGEALDLEAVTPLVDLSFLIAPYIELDGKLREAAELEDTPMSVVSSILRTAKVAELQSFGRIAYDRVRVIDRVAELKDDPATLEDQFQELIEEAPWLIDPQWAPITANQSLKNVKAAFATFFKKRTGQDLELTDFSSGKKRPDFVMIAPGSRLEIIEIKKPHHSFTNTEYERLDTYYRELTAFFADPGHQKIRDEYPKGFHITLVCDAIGVTGTALTAYQGLENGGSLTRINWEDFLFRTKQAHKDFLAKAEEQKKYAK